MNMAKKKISFGKPFRKKGRSGSLRKGSLVRYKYVDGRRVATVKAVVRRKKA